MSLLIIMVETTLRLEFVSPNSLSFHACLGWGLLHLFKLWVNEICSTGYLIVVFSDSYNPTNIF